MKRITRKLYISILTTFLLILVGTTVTYAWFEMNQNAYVSNIDLEVTTGDGILISADGNYYSQGISEKAIKRAIVSKKLGYTYKQSSGGSYLLYNESNQVVELSDERVENEFEKIRLEPVTSLDGKKYANRTGKDIQVTSGNYISFTLFARTNKIITDNTKVPIYFVTEDIAETEESVQINKTGITGEEISFKPLNTLYTYDKLTGKRKIYTPSDLITVNAADATRFSVSTKDTTKIYEINNGLGSYATNLTSKSYLENGLNKGAAYDSTKNAGFTYYNSVVSKQITPLEYQDVIDAGIYNSFNTLESAYITEVGSNEVVSFDITLWLEGWDADCFDALFSSKISAQFSFTTANPAENQPRTVSFLPRDLEDMSSSKESIMVVEDQMVAQQIDIPKIPISKRNGNRFAYWSVDGITPFDFSTTIKKDIVFLAVYQVDLEFELFGGILDEEAVVYAGEVISLPSPTKLGYTFIGWYLDETLENGLSADDVFLKSTKLFAKYEKNQYQIEYIVPENTVNSNPTTVDIDTSLSAPSLVDYIFEGWYLDENYSIPYEITNQTSTAEKTKVYAKFTRRTIQIHCLTYDITLPVELGYTINGIFTINKDTVVRLEVEGYSIQYYSSSIPTADNLVNIEEEYLGNDIYIMLIKL